MNCGGTNEKRPLWPGDAEGKRPFRAANNAFPARFSVPETRREDCHCHLPNEAGVTDVTDLSNLNHVP